ncbi:hypothetical protein OsJ_01763 [Oryza sativa Japonica Group]|uniref:Uncharacterized protein n=1 Tax=Oryza sativa subsp. japonica TaxID=39947 RepID=A2ZT41_ORYSJ|nr:hypothetical protein OsJ_01763 [Oryza sativa Japonica Group]
MSRRFVVPRRIDDVVEERERGVRGALLCEVFSGPKEESSSSPAKITGDRQKWSMCKNQCRKQPARRYPAAPMTSLPQPKKGRGCPRHPLEEVEEPMTGLIYCVATRRARSMLPEPTSGEGEQLELVPSLDLPAELAADLVTISHFVLQSLPSFPILCRSPRGSPTDLVPRSYAAIIVAVSSSMPLTSRRSRRCPIELGFLRAICAAMERHLGVVAGVGEREGWWWP